MKLIGWSRRQTYIFLMVEIVLAGVLVLLNLAVGTALLLVGLIMGMALWVYDQRPGWLPTRLHSYLKGSKVKGDDTPFEYDGCAYRANTYAETDTGLPVVSVNRVYIGIRNGSGSTALGVTASVCRDYERTQMVRYDDGASTSLPPNGTEFFHVLTVTTPGVSYGPSIHDALNRERFIELSVQGGNWLSWFVGFEDRKFHLRNYRNLRRIPPERIEIEVRSANRGTRRGFVTIGWDDQMTPLAVVVWA